jgi:hypothetical protein
MQLYVQSTPIILQAAFGVSKSLLLLLPEIWHPNFDAIARVTEALRLCLSNSVYSRSSHVVTPGAS